MIGNDMELTLDSGTVKRLRRIQQLRGFDPEDDQKAVIFAIGVCWLECEKRADRGKKRDT